MVQTNGMKRLSKYFLPVLFLIAAMPVLCFAQESVVDKTKYKILTFIQAEGNYDLKGKKCFIEYENDGKNNDGMTSTSLKQFFAKALYIEEANLVDDISDAELVINLKYSYLIPDGLSKAPRLRKAHKYEMMAYQTPYLMDSKMKDAPYSSMLAMYEDNKARAENEPSSEPLFNYAKSRRELIVALRIKNPSENKAIGNILIIASTSNKTDFDILPPFIAYLSINKYGLEYKKWEKFKLTLKDEDFHTFLSS